MKFFNAGNFCLPEVHLFQIAYSYESASAIGSGFQLLENFENERPDWYEYWSIRKFLLTRVLDREAFYGFFSPKFSSKTNLFHADVVDFVRRHAASYDVMLFSPQPDMGAYFLNVFEQAEVFDPGFIDAFGAFLAAIDNPIPIQKIVMDSRQVVFSNYFVARPKFWREWLAINEALFQFCEGPPSALRDALCKPTTYPGAAQRKVFIQERTASLLLSTQPKWRSIAYNPFGMAWSASRFADYPQEAIISDALKMAFREQLYPQYIDAFVGVREQFRNNADPYNNLSTGSRPEPSSTGEDVSGTGPAVSSHHTGRLAGRVGRFKSLTDHALVDTPVYVPTFNNPTYTRMMTDQLRARGLHNIVVVDNASSLPEMIDLLHDLDREMAVIRLHGNQGPHAIFTSDAAYDQLPDVFCLTDPDIRFNPDMPRGFMSDLLEMTYRFSIGKAGLALQISDRHLMRPDEVHHAGKSYRIWEWEDQFWLNLVGHVDDATPVYGADTDTTFALYNKKFFDRKTFYAAVRVAGSFAARHIPWYVDNEIDQQEEDFYRSAQRYSTFYGLS